MASLMAMAAAAASSATVGGVMATVSTLSTVVGGVTSFAQAEAQQDQIDLQARTAEVNGRLEAIAINDELLKTLSSNNAVAGAKGLASSGSVARAGEAAQRKASQALSVNQFNTTMETTALTAKADAVGNSGVVSLTGSLFDAASSGYSSYSSYKGT